MQFYTDATRENEPTALPDAEVFYVDAKEADETRERLIGEGVHETDMVCETSCEGFYWRLCFPGCLPDSDPEGPFDTQSAAIRSARGDYDVPFFDPKWSHMTSAQVSRLTEIYHRKADRPICEDRTLDEFMASATPIDICPRTDGSRAYGVHAHGMMVGVEPDGHAHT